VAWLLVSDVADVRAVIILMVKVFWNKVTSGRQVEIFRVGDPVV
jgi:hypothetical protein